jgi:maltose alpha-D-glucosyltransferase/alpha-amylase
MVLFDGWTSFFRDKVVPWRIRMAEELRGELEAKVLPRFIEKQRWYAQKGEAVKRAEIRDHVIWDVGGVSWLLNFIATNNSLYFLPLAFGWEDDEDHMRALSATAIARVRQQANVGIMADALADEALLRHIVKSVGEGRTLKTEQGELRFTPSAAFAQIAGGEVTTLTPGALRTQSTNTSVVLGDRLFLKAYRRLRPGLHPELEVGRYLTEVARFKHCVPLAGSVEYFSKEKESMTLALLQAFVPNQGDAWSYTLGYLERFSESKRAGGGHGGFLALMQMLATRTAELHLAFAAAKNDPAFTPEPLTVEDVDAWRARVREEATQTIALIGELKEKGNQIMSFIDACPAPKKRSLRTRHHGDYHLGQVLMSNNDFLIIDFEGEPSRPLAEARRKHSPLRDVAGMLRSFSYARGSVEIRERVQELSEWEKQTRKAFVDAYAKAAAGSGLYEDFDDVRGLLRLAEMEKVLYELRYEKNNRPNWLHIPLQGLTALLQGD